jgi:hypothetical protein
LLWFTATLPVLLNGDFNQKLFQVFLPIGLFLTTAAVLALRLGGAADTSEGGFRLLRFLETDPDSYKPSAHPKNNPLAFKLLLGLALILSAGPLILFFVGLFFPFSSR